MKKADKKVKKLEKKIQKLETKLSKFKSKLTKIKSKSKIKILAPIKTPIIPRKRKIEKLR